MWWNAEVVRFRENLTAKINQAEPEAYNWVVSICLKYVSLPWNMVNSLRRGASEPWAWREFYQAWSLKEYKPMSFEVLYFQGITKICLSQISDVIMSKINGFQM